MKQLKVQTANTVQMAIPALKREEKTLYYLIIGEGDDQVVINVGDKTYKSVENLLKKEEVMSVGEKTVRSKDTVTGEDEKDYDPAQKQEKQKR